MTLKTHVAAPGSTNSERLTARPAREGFVVICACTEPIGAGIGAVCVERGRPKWPRSIHAIGRRSFEIKTDDHFFEFLKIAKPWPVTVYRLPIRLPAKSALTWPVV